MKLSFTLPEWLSRLFLSKALLEDHERRTQITGKASTSFKFKGGDLTVISEANRDRR